MSIWMHENVWMNEWMYEYNDYKIIIMIYSVCTSMYVCHVFMNLMLIILISLFLSLLLLLLSEWASIQQLF